MIIEALKINDILNKTHKKIKNVTYMTEQEVASEITNDRRNKFCYNMVAKKL